MSSSPTVDIYVIAQPKFVARGGESGGGGFYKNSQALLEVAISDLKKKIASASPSAISVIAPEWNAQGWTLQKLSTLVDQVRLEPNTPSTPRPGSDQPLLFDYGTDTSGPYLVALHDYFSSFESVEPDDSPYGDPDKSFPASVLFDVETRIMHEFSHLLGIGLQNDEDSDVFAKKALKSMSVCQNSDKEEQAWQSIPSPQNPNELLALLATSNAIFYDKCIGIADIMGISIAGDEIHYRFRSVTDITGTLSMTSDGMVDPELSGLGYKISKSEDGKHHLLVRKAANNACGDANPYFYHLDYGYPVKDPLQFKNFGGGATY